MKASFFALAAVVGLASAQNFAGVPSCAVPCLTSAIAGIGCQLTDVGCACAQTAALQASAGSCIIGVCTAPGEIQSAIAGGLGLCSAYLATASASATTPAATPASTTSSGIATSTVTPHTTSVPSPTTTPAPAHNSTTIRTGGVTSTRATTSSQVPVGAGVKVAGSLGAIGGVVLAFFAL